MKLYLGGHADCYTMEQLQLALFPGEALERVDTAGFSGDGASCVLHRGSTWLTATARITWQGRQAKAVCRLLATKETVPSRRQVLARSYYLAAVQLLPQAPAWGSLSGVRPTKLTTRHLLAGGSKASAEAMLRETYFVSPERSALCADASLATVAAGKRLRPRDVSLYVGIPFCPTRCSYCSFVSQAIERCAGLLEEYLESLFVEIRHVGEKLREVGAKVRTLYIGGGTPTTLSAAQLARLMRELEESFDLSELLEYTVEGGRPDTLDAEKLRVLFSYGCDRISINPQTMNEEALRAIGRRHSAADTLRAYQQAEAAGFTAINMDLIAGLPADTRQTFAETLAQILALGPANITVHTLAMKKGAALFRERCDLPAAGEVEGMLHDAQAALRAAGYVPYYLYRQKYMSGSFENVGWTKPGFEGLYNIYMMEELHTIISLGGGGMTKLMLPDGHLERQHNPKAPQQYLSRMEDTLAQKDRVFEKLKTFPAFREE